MPEGRCLSRGGGKDGCGLDGGWGLRNRVHIFVFPPIVYAFGVLFRKCFPVSGLHRFSIIVPFYRHSPEILRVRFQTIAIQQILQ